MSFAPTAVEQFARARADLRMGVPVVLGDLLVAAAETVTAARLAVGSCSAAAQRLPDLEAALQDKPCDAALAAVVEPDHLGGLAPIDDVRGSADYRRDAALTLVRRALLDLVDAGSEMAA